MLTSILIGFVGLNVAHGSIIAKHALIVRRDTSLSSSYDFVVIGGGTSGLTVADRLTEHPDSTWLR